MLTASPAVVDAPRLAEPGSAAVFRARGLAKVYRMGEVEVHALRAVDLDLYRGGLVVVLGPSGSGKSTLLNILGGLDVPTAGRVHFFEPDRTARAERERTRFLRAPIGVVFQLYNLTPRAPARAHRALVTDTAKHPRAHAAALR